MKAEKKPAVSAAGLRGLDGNGRCALFPRQNFITPPRRVKLVVLCKLAEIAKQRGDYEGFWGLRRAYLLAQAAAYQAGEGAQ